MAHHELRLKSSKEVLRDLVLKRWLPVLELLFPLWFCHTFVLFYDCNLPASLGGVIPTGFTGLGTNTLTWTISPLSLGSFATMLAGSGPNALVDAAGTPLRGGAGFSQNLKVLWGDFNDDGFVSATDLVGVNNATIAPYNVFADMNGDGAVNTNDVQIVRTRIGTLLP